MGSPIWQRLHFLSWFHRPSLWGQARSSPSVSFCGRLMETRGRTDGPLRSPLEDKPMPMCAMCEKNPAFEGWESAYTCPTCEQCDAEIADAIDEWQDELDDCLPCPVCGASDRTMCDC